MRILNESASGYEAILRVTELFRNNVSLSTDWPKDREAVANKLAAELTITVPFIYALMNSPLLGNFYRSYKEFEYIFKQLDAMSYDILKWFYSIPPIANLVNVNDNLLHRKNCYLVTEGGKDICAFQMGSPNFKKALTRNQYFEFLNYISGLFSLNNGYIKFKALTATDWRYPTSRKSTIYIIKGF